MEAMVGILGFIYQELIHSELESNLNNTFLAYYKTDPDKTVAIDFLQEEVIVKYHNQVLQHWY